MAEDRDIRQLLNTVVRPAIHPRRVPMDVAAHHLHGEPIPAEEALAGPFESFEGGRAWGGAWDTTWFRLRATVPPDWAGAEVAALVHLGGDEIVGFAAEGQIWDQAARPVQGLHHRHREHLVTERAAGGETVDLYVEAAANPIPTWHLADWPLLVADYAGEALYVLDQADLATVDREVEALYHDMVVLAQLARQCPERSGDILTALAEAAAEIDHDCVTARAPAARAALAPALALRTSSAHRVAAVGHAHIDSAWLWPVRETIRKCARTFSNQLRLMERYPEHRFACSQAVQYRWVKDRYPHLYAQIKDRVREGRWEPVGGMWVEPDTNIPSGESLVRQVVHGKRFFADELGVETRELWLPDVFGYSAALPQIGRLAGIDSIVTQKMSWNDTNVFPHSSFWWEGHDGSRLFAHFPPADTYNGEFSVAEVAKSRDNHRDRSRSDRSLYPYGYGDGGGGPTKAMLERARRLGDLDPLPAVQIAAVGGWLGQVRSEALAKSAELAVWTGELYLEAHRGTFTTHADVKTSNRRGEEVLRGAEMWSVAAGLDRRDVLDDAWKLLLLNQFHDILPGSSIHWVYEDARRDHAEVLDVAARVAAEAQAALAGDEPTVFNTSSHPRTEVVDHDGVLRMVSVPACGWAPLRAGPDAGPGASSAGVEAACGTVETSSSTVEIGDGWVENDHLRVAWDGSGLLTSVWDKIAGREVLADGRRGNLFQLHEDHPKAFDAWDVDREYLDSCIDLEEVESIEVCERDRLRAGVRIVRRFGDSAIDQTMRLAAGSRRLEFHTEVDWHERHRFLKVAFPVAVRSARATYEIQHGHVERPTVANTSWDEARFEVCAHRWADLSEAGYGVALINDCKYGYDIRGSVMRLSLLRGPGYPDPEADQGRHRFAYALLPHPGDLRAPGGVIGEAEAFNLPLRVVPGSTPAPPLVGIDRPGVSIEAVKKADREDAMVVRLCEVWGSRGPARVTVNGAVASATRTDLLERDIEALMVTDNSVSLQLRPFELVTLKFTRSST
ncbi:MAG: alpha-mannosidase [Acidimicrobiales bacterium]